MEGTSAPKPANLKARIDRLEHIVGEHGDRLQEHRDDINGLADEIGTTTHSDQTPKPERERK